MKSKQLSLFEKSKTGQRYGRTEYGGVRTKGFRKLERPLSTKKWIHLVLKSDKAVGSLSFLSLKNKSRVENLLKQKAKKFGVLIAELVNVGNHFHLKVKITDRENFGNYLRSVTTLVAKLVTGAKKGNRFGRFWQGLAYTRVLKTAFEELRLKGYFQANRIEVSHSALEREMHLKRFSRWIRTERKQASSRTLSEPLTALVLEPI
jgi:hypothetical protein